MLTTLFNKIPWAALNPDVSPDLYDWILARSGPTDRLHGLIGQALKK
jgi:hypothetical protein